MFCYHGHNKEKTLIIQFGSGLIGSQLTNIFKTHLRSDYIPFDWNDVAESISALNTEYIGQFEYEKVDIIWAAGKVGFSATNDEVDVEISNFKVIVGHLKDLFSACKRLRFWLMSSAGGLFEGQTFVNRESVPDPQRPYGVLKLHQEEFVRECFADFNLCRISSVYTNTNLKGRLGLIPILVRNGVQNKVSTIFGTESTLRDYILDKEIATIITDSILYDTKLPEICYLIGGQAVSIRTIINRVEDIILKKLLIKYVIVPTNSSNISFSSRLKPPELKTAPFQVNLKVLYNNILSNKIN